MVTKTRTNNRPHSKNREPVIVEQPFLPVYNNSLLTESEETWPEVDSKNAFTGVADTDNLVYLYLSEMGQTPKLNALEEKQIKMEFEHSWRTFKGKGHKTGQEVKIDLLFFLELPKTLSLLVLRSWSHAV